MASTCASPPRAIRWAVSVIARQPSLLFGVVGIVILWVGVLHSLSVERQGALDITVRDTGNFTRAFQEQITGIFRAVDQTLLYVRAAYIRDPDRFDIERWTEHSEFLTDPAFQVSIIGKDGYLVANSLGPVTTRLDLGDREHFRVPAASTTDLLFISKPVIGRVSRKWSIQLARRILGRDGAFAGVVVVSLDPLYLSQLYNSLNIGTEGVATLVGADGIIRSRVPGAGRGIGESLAGTLLMRAIGKSPSGNYSVFSKVDGIRRIFSYRAVEGYPLYVVVGIGEREALAGYHHDLRAYLTVAALVSALLLVVIVLLIRHRIGHDRTRAALDQSNAGYAEKSRLLEVTLDNMTQGIMLIDAELTLQVVNRRAAELMNLPETLLTTQPSLRDVLHIAWRRGDFGPCARTFEEWFDGFMADHAGVTHVREHYQTNGPIVEIISRNLPDGRVVRTFTDITERKRAEDALRAARDEATRSAQAKSEFLAMMSHEIRSPMSALLGIIELLHDTGLDSDQREMVALLRGSGASLLRVLNDVLDFSKIDAGMIELQVEPTELRQFVSALTGSIAPAATVKGLSLTAEVADALPAWISTDPARLRQIMINLLGNAIKFTAEGSVHLCITGATLSGSGNAVSFAVSDTGIGIAIESIGHLFEPFTQADASTTRTFGGTGLGLTISRRLARLLGGDIAVSSEPGHGSVFTLCIPLVQGGAAGTIDRTSDQDLGLPAHRILIAEDQPTNRWLLERQLERLGCSVATVPDGRAALAALDAVDYDMLITDCHMPEIDGVALTQMIRAVEQSRGKRRMPIVGLTADATTAMRDRCFAAGMSEVAAKPIDLRHLQATIARLVHNSGAAPVEEAGSSGDAAVFDPANWCELFADDAAEGRRWLAAFLVAATGLVDLVTQAVTDGDRDLLAAEAHKLASASLGVGAIRLGLLARQLEVAAAHRPEPDLRRSAEAVASASHEARAAIDECLSAEESVA
jgi:signal transduction histidine kinase/CheY-like chemotaxis protein/HPt (histidine-containing phosphotransfer) domain-containing protein